MREGPRSSLWRSQIFVRPPCPTPGITQLPDFLSLFVPPEVLMVNVQRSRFDSSNEFLEFLSL